MSPRRCCGLLLAAVGCAIGAAAGPAWADSMTWNGVVSEAWHTGPWSPSVPTATDSATFSATGSPYVVDFEFFLGDPTINDLFVTGGDVLFQGLGIPRPTLHVAGTGGSNGVNVSGSSLLTLGGEFGSSLKLDVAGAVNVEGGNLKVTASSDVDVDGDINIGSTAPGSSLMVIDGSGATVNQIGAGALTVRRPTTGSAELAIGAFASFNTGSGLMTIENGLVTIGSTTTTGTLNANGNVLIDGGRLFRGPGSTFQLAAGRTMTVNAGDALFSGNYSTAAGATYIVTGDEDTFGDLRVTNGGFLEINSGATVNVEPYGELTAADHIHVGVNGNGTLTVNGSLATETLATAPGQNHWGDAGHSAHVTFSNNANGTFGGPTYIGRNQSAAGTTTATVDVLSGAKLTVGSLALDDLGHANATLNVSGANSKMTVSGAATVGHASSGTAVVNVVDNGRLDVWAARCL